MARQVIFSAMVALLLAAGVANAQQAYVHNAADGADEYGGATVLSAGPMLTAVTDEAAPPPAKSPARATPAKAAPKPPATIAEAAAATPSLSTLLAAVKASALLPAATNASTAVTVFAPTNAAFAAALKKLNITAAALLANKATLNRVLSYHIVPAVVFSKNLKPTQTVQTLLGKTPTLTITVRNGTVTVRGAKSTARVTKADVKAGKSAVHIIDTVLLP